MNSDTPATSSITRQALVQRICSRIDQELERIGEQWRTGGSISHFVVDDLLPREWAQRIAAAFPSSGSMMLRRSLRELKYVSAQMNQHDPLLEDAIFAFQAPEVVERVERITGLRSLEPDELLYAGGISVMGQTHFLNPHIDNSHDKSRQRYRVLNLLYYVSPDWKLENGGNLELWPDGPEGKQLTIISTFNRLVVMVTHQRSWHSVSPIAVPFNRCCISNYYFSRFPVGDAEYFHVTSFRGRPEQPARDLALRADALMRGWVRKIFPTGVRETRHYYKGKKH
jgi:Rps23 Pro-64 3,4-dihydroxylase Tpa1-like proline 4-hydroxylase